jgi:hypothetical protein
MFSCIGSAGALSCAEPPQINASLSLLALENNHIGEGGAVPISVAISAEAAVHQRTSTCLQPVALAKATSAPKH